MKSKIAFAFLAIYLIWGSTFLATRVAVRTIPPFFVSGGRFFVAGVVLFAIGRARNHEPLHARNWAAAALMGGMFFLICHGGLAWAAQHVPSGISALLMASVSLWTALLEWLRGSSNRPSRLVIWSLLAGFLGITALVIHPEALSGSGGAPLGAGIALIGAFSWAAGTVLTRRMPLTQSTAVNSGMQMLAGGAMLLLLGLATEPLPTIAALSWQPVTAMLFLTLIGSLVGFTCYLWLLSVVPATQVATYAYVNPIVAVLLGWAVAGERLTLRSLAASAVVLVAVIVIVSSRKRTASDHPAAKSTYSVDRMTARV